MTPAKLVFLPIILPFLFGHGRQQSRWGYWGAGRLELQVAVWQGFAHRHQPFLPRMSSLLIQPFIISISGLVGVGLKTGIGGQQVGGFLQEGVK